MSNEPDDVIGQLAPAELDSGPKVVQVSQQMEQWAREVRRLRDTIDEIGRCYGTLSADEKAEVPRIAWEIVTRGEHGTWDEFRAEDHAGSQFCPACGFAVPHEMTHEHIAPCNCEETHPGIPHWEYEYLLEQGRDK